VLVAVLLKYALFVKPAGAKFDGQYSDEETLRATKNVADDNFVFDQDSTVG